MEPNYDVYIEVAEGQFELAPNPPPFSWRERKGVCKGCGEKVFVKAGSERCYWTHGKGKTCVPKPNPVSAYIDASEFQKNAGAQVEGDEALKARFKESQTLAKVPPFVCKKYNKVDWIVPKPHKKEFLLKRIVKVGVSLGWVEASLVINGVLNELKRLSNLPAVGTNGILAIHYKDAFSQEDYDFHLLRAKERFLNATIPSYEELRANRRNFFWAMADYEIVDENNKPFVRLQNVRLLSSPVLHIFNERTFWALDSSDSQLISLGCG